MMDCVFNTDGPPWVCVNCGYRFPLDRPAPPRRNCTNPPDLREPAAELGITPADIKRYVAALWRWTRAGKPTRSDAEVERIHTTLCQPCEFYRNGRCGKCRCHLAGQPAGVLGLVLVPKIKMATESCPVGKW